QQRPTQQGQPLPPSGIHDVSWRSLSLGLLTADSPGQRSNVEAPTAYDRPADVTGGLWIVNDEKPSGRESRGFSQLSTLRARRRKSGYDFGRLRIMKLS